MLDWSVIIVNWNTRERLRECLRSVFASVGITNFEVFVVDNASSDGSAEMVEKEFSRSRLIKNKRNLGFAVANNLAIKRAQGSYILLLNPDCKISSGALENMYLFMRGHPRAGVCGGRLFEESGGIQPSVRSFPTFFSQATILLKIHKLFPNLQTINNYLSLGLDYGRSSKVDQVMGAFFAVPRHIFSEVGLLDERFFLWFEEVDFCKRVKQAGYDVFYTPIAEATHSGGASFNQLLSAEKQKIWNKSLDAYMRKHHKFWTPLALKPFFGVARGLAWFYDKFSRHESR